MESTRKFETGATRSADAHRDDPEGFLSPLAIDRFNEYMTKHRLQPDGTLRDSDNWQKGMPLKTYMKGMWRHFLHAWTRHRGWPVRDPGATDNIEEDLCSIIFNAQGYLHETIKARLMAERVEDELGVEVRGVEKDGEYMELSDGRGGTFKVRFTPTQSGTPVVERTDIAYYSSVLGPIQRATPYQHEETGKGFDKDGFYAEVGRRYGCGL